MNGARSDQSNITLDGVDVNTDTKGYAFAAVLPITQDSVQEFRVTTSNYNADQGRSSGAQVSLVTRSGSNDFHGGVFETHRNTITSANDYFIKLAELQSGESNTPPKLLRNNFGGYFGGPIKKDRLFFFVNYEGHRQREAQSVVRIVPSAAMQDGVIQYACAPTTDSDGNVIATAVQNCPGMTVSGLSGTHTVAPGNFGLSPSNIQGMDPQGIGVSTNVMIPYLQSFAPYQGNDNSVGDGLNFVGYRFSGPVAINTNWYIARADYKLTSNGNHTIFWRGALRNDTEALVPYLPGGNPLETQVNYSKGYSVGYTAVLRPNLVNNFRYGYTRESFGQIGNQTDNVIFFRGLNDNSTPNNSSLTYTSNSTYQVPVHNFVDDVSWIKGKHTFQFGFNIDLIRNPQQNNINSFTSASDNPSWLDLASMANTGAPGHFDPGFEGFPRVDDGFDNNYDYPMGALIGMVTQVNAQYNYNKDGSTLPDGAPVSRRFGADSWEIYAQDTWKIKPTLTLTLGLRYSLFSPPWETNGLQVTPQTSLSDYFNQRGERCFYRDSGRRRLLPHFRSRWSCEWQAGILRLGQERLWASGIARLGAKCAFRVLEVALWRRRQDGGQGWVRRGLRSYRAVVAGDFRRQRLVRTFHNAYQLWWRGKSSDRAARYRNFRFRKHSDARPGVATEYIVNAGASGNVPANIPQRIRQRYRFLCGLLRHGQQTEDSVFLRTRSFGRPPTWPRLFAASVLRWPVVASSAFAV